MACSISTFPLFPLLLAFLSAPPCRAATPKVVERVSKTCPIFRENLLDDVMFLQAANQDKVQVCRCLSDRTTNRFTCKFKNQACEDLCQKEEACHFYDFFPQDGYGSSHCLLYRDCRRRVREGGDTCQVSAWVYYNTFYWKMCAYEFRFFFSFSSTTMQVHAFVKDDQACHQNCFNLPGCR